MRSPFEEMKPSGSSGQTVPSAFAIFLDILPEGMAATESNIAATPEIASVFYLDYVSYLMENNIPILPLLEIKSLGKALFFHSGDSRTNAIAMGYLICCYQRFASADDVQIYTIYDASFQDASLTGFNTKKAWFLYFLKDLENAVQNSEKRKQWIVTKLLAMFRDEFKNHPYHMEHYFAKLILIFEEAGVYQYVRSEIIDLLDVSGQLKGLRTIDALLKIQDYALVADLFDQPGGSYNDNIICAVKSLSDPPDILKKIYETPFDRRRLNLLRNNYPRYKIEGPYPKKELSGKYFYYLPTLKEWFKKAIPDVITLAIPPHQIPAEMPVGLAMAILNSEHDVQKTFASFGSLIKRYNKALTYSKTHGVTVPLAWADFVTKNNLQLINLFDCFGPSLFPFMEKMLATSPNKLARYFDTMYFIFPEYYGFLMELKERFTTELINKEPSSFDAIIILLSQLEELKLQLNSESLAGSLSTTDFLKHLKRMLPSSSLPDVEKHIFVTIIALFKKVIHLEEESNFDVSKLNYQIARRLLIGRKNLASSGLLGIFDKLLQQDLTQGQNFVGFSENPNQEDPLGKSLSKHNQQIIQELAEKKIDTDLAFNYSRKQSFNTKTGTDVDIPELARAVYNDLENLESTLTALIRTPAAVTFFGSNPTDAILGQIKKIKKEVCKGDSKKTTQLENGILDGKLKIIEDLVQKLLASEVPDGVREHANHFFDHKKLLIDSRQRMQNNPKQPKSQSKKTEFFVQQWDKGQIESFLLGDYLGCCLAPDGSRFYAMVQRRLDKAMMMHVVYDKTLNEPVCGNWLFFAKDKAHPNDIYVVANFFEIRAGYGLNLELRDKLVAELLAFTGQYASEIHAKGFIMRPLTYGLIPDFSANYSQKQLCIEKVGGFFSPDEIDYPDQVMNNYYLEALNLDFFYTWESATPVIHLQQDPDSEQKKQPGM